MTPDSVHEDAAAYALGALAPADAQRFEHHLARCGVCRDELASYGPVLRALAATDVPRPANPPRPVAPRAFIRAFAVAAAVAVLIGGGFAGGVLRGHADDARDVAVSSMLADPRREVHVDRGPEHLRVLVGRRGERTAIVVAGLPSVRPGRVHQVWIDGRSPGLLERTVAGSEVLVVAGDRLTGSHRIGISDEPAGGSPTRSTPALISMQTSRD